MRFATLGPAGSCHDYALRHYLEHHSVADAEVVLIYDFLAGLERLHAGEFDYLMQNSAHSTVHILTEKYYPEVCVADVFLFTTKELALLEDARVEVPRTLGLVKATEGYLEEGGFDYAERSYEISKPIVGEKFLEGAYEAALTYMEYYHRAPERVRVRKYIGHVPTAWLVYGKVTAFHHEVLGSAAPGFYQGIGMNTAPGSWDRVEGRLLVPAR